jgi:hypothetical protein
LPQEKIGEAWKAVNLQFGTFKKKVGERIEKINENNIEYNIIYVNCEFEKGFVDFKIVFNPEKKIAGLFIVPSQSIEVVNAIKSSSGELVDLMVKEDFEGASKNFNDTMKKQLTEAKFKESWQGVLKQNGAFKNRLEDVVKREEPFDVVYMKCEFEKATLDIKVVFDKEKKISGLSFNPLQSPELQKELEGLSGKMINSMVKEDFASVIKNFDKTMKTDLPEPTFKVFWKDFISKVGAFKKIDVYRSEKEQGFDVVYGTCEFEKAIIEIRFVFDSQKKVAGLYFIPTKGL